MADNKKRSGLGPSVLDSIISGSNTRTIKLADRAIDRDVAGPELQMKRERYTLNLPDTLIERARNAAWATREPLTRICERAIEAEMVNLEKKNGGPFNDRPGNLQVGRPLA